MKLEKLSQEEKITLINFQKKQVKIISIIIAAVFIFSIVGIGVSQYESSSAGASSSNVGIVDYSQLISQHPGMQAAREKYQAEAQQMQDEFNQKAASMTPEQQQEYVVQKQKEMQDKQKELIDPIRQDIEKNVKDVADTRGINVVLDKNNVLYGGQDITQSVLQKIQAEGDTTSSDTATSGSDASSASSDANAASSDAAASSSSAAQ